MGWNLFISDSILLLRLFASDIFFIFEYKILVVVVDIIGKILRCDSD